MSGHHRWADLRDNRRFLAQTGVDRRLGLFCMCPLLDCCHNEDQDPCRAWGTHAHSGSPASGYLYPWEPGDESWRDAGVADVIAALGRRSIWVARRATS